MKGEITIPEKSEGFIFDDSNRNGPLKPILDFKGFSAQLKFIGLFSSFLWKKVTVAAESYKYMRKKVKYLYICVCMWISVHM